MRNTIASAAVLGAAAVSAVPYGPLNSGWGSNSGSASGSSPNSAPSSTGSQGGWNSGSWGSWSGSSGVTPFKFPLSNGFPNVDANTLRQIEQQAHGTLPNGQLPTHIGDGSATVFQLIRFNEVFEVAFFSSLLNNITSHARGYDVSNHQFLEQFIVDAITVVQAQEELHALGAGGILQTAGRDVPDPCEYVFPSDSLDTALDFARTFTDVVLGTLQAAQVGLAANGDNEFLALLGSVQGQEGEQNGFYRSFLNKVPSELPFLTLSDPRFAFSILNQKVIVPGSCSGKGNDDLFKAISILEPLNVVNPEPDLSNQDVKFTVSSNMTQSDFQKLKVVFINSQNVPVVSDIENVSVSGNTISFQAYFAAADLIANGLTISAVADPSVNKLDTVPNVAAASIFGPGLIEIN